MGEVPVTALKVEVLALDRGLFEQIRIMRVAPESLTYDPTTRHLKIDLGRDGVMDVPLLGYVWEGQHGLYKSCYWLITSAPGGLMRVHVRAPTRDHRGPPFDGVPQVMQKIDG